MRQLFVVEWMEGSTVLENSIHYQTPSPYLSNLNTRGERLKKKRCANKIEIRILK